MGGTGNRLSTLLPAPFGVLSLVSAVQASREDKTFLPQATEEAREEVSPEATDGATSPMRAHPPWIRQFPVERYVRIWE